MQSKLVFKESGAAAYATLKYIMSWTAEQVEQYTGQVMSSLEHRQAARLSFNEKNKSVSLSSPFGHGAAGAAKNDARNRYMDIVPFDHNRVMLDQVGQENDYINASWVGDDDAQTELLTMDALYTGIKAPSTPAGRRYIACQGPLPHTCADFWRMVLEHDVHVIACLTPEIEKQRIKCAAYWPKDDENETIFEFSVPPRRSLSMHLESQQEKQDNDPSLPPFRIHVRNTAPPQRRQDADCLHRTILVQCKRLENDQWVNVQTRTVHHLHFLGWPDYSTPANTHHILALIRLANQLQPEHAPPMVVHCSAGCGRTGSFAVIDSIVRWLEPYARSDIHNHNDTPVPAPPPPMRVDPVQAMTELFRQQRVSMVQAVAQYRFCYRAIWDALHPPSSSTS
ncbi:protein-tyrosine phosphatase-like protein [Gongronella butleri]|nr:protein-tyrosine phosphatase-like protein [Gongronella butleri]